VALPKVVRVPVGQHYSEVDGITGAIGVWLHSDGGKSPQRVGLSAPSSLTLARIESQAIGGTVVELFENLLTQPLCPGEIAR